MSLIKKDRENDELNNIIAYLQNTNGEVYLPNPLLERLDRIDFCDNIIRRFGRPQAVKMLMQKYNIMSKATAYKIINDTLYVYNSTHNQAKEYWRNVLLDLQYAEIIKCKANGDSKGLNAGIKNLIEITGLNRDDSKITADMLQQHNIFFNISLAGGAEKYEISSEKMAKLSNDERMKLVRAVEAETIEFDMVDFIEKSENDVIKE